ncbi:hypothetical protein BGAFAR04_0259, partial [Borreliella garinii Far04]
MRIVFDIFKAVVDKSRNIDTTNIRQLIIVIGM